MTFFKTILAAAFGFFLALALITLFFFLSFGALLIGGGGKEGDSIKSHSILKLDLNYSMPEKSDSGWPSSINPLAINWSASTGLNDVMDILDAASKDDDIDGILIDLQYNPNGLTKLKEVLGALDELKKSGKFVLAYGQNITQKSYYLASAADQVYLHPSGMLDLKGFNAELSFYTRALEKLGVEVQVFYDGKYKSATEPFRLEKMSEENRHQLHEFLDEIWSQYLDDVSQGRGFSREKLQESADSLTGYFASDALSNKLVDGLLYPDELNDLLRDKLDLQGEDKIPFVTMENYRTSRVQANSSKNKSKSKIAVIYAEGEINFGSSSPGRIGSDDLSKLLRKAREDKDVKAVVLRVNSPGGVAPASDMIWREAQLLAEEKTLVVSMGDLAASAGYQISAPADYIVAQPNTLTGSIGVFLLLPNMQNLLENKLGITSDTVKTGELADFPSVNRPVSERQRTILQRAVDSTYVQFKQNVAQGRGMSMEAVENLAQGRIWTGNQALERGLVDTLGSLQTAITKAAELARLGSDYQLIEWPKEDLSPFEEIVLTLMQSNSGVAGLEALKPTDPTTRSGVTSPMAMFTLLNSPLGQALMEHASLLQWVQEAQIQKRLPYTLQY